MSVPTVSIVLPVYNGAHLIKNTLQTILTQDFSDFELIIVDDGSTDGTLDVIHTFSDPRIRVIEFSQNKGIGAARNRGVQEATGEFVALADADDHWVENKLSKQVETLLQYPQIDLLFSDFENINEIIGTSDSGFAQTKLGLDLLQTQTLSDTLVFILDKGVDGLLVSNFIQTSSLFLRRSIVNRNENFRSDLRRAADYEFTLRAAAMGMGFAYHTDILVKRYKTKQSVTANPGEFIPHILEVLEKFENFCLKHNRSDLIPLINQKKSQIWRIQVRLYGRTGDRKMAWHAFRKSAHYGKITPRVLVYFFAAMIGPSFMQLISKIRA